VGKQDAKKIHMAGFNLKILKEEEVNTFAALENLWESGDMNRARDTIRENIKISARVLVIVN
jgi:hypothetical protein